MSAQYVHRASVRFSGRQPFRQSLDSPEFVEIVRFLAGTVPKAAPPTESTIVDR